MRDGTDLEFRDREGVEGSVRILPSDSGGKYMVLVRIGDGPLLGLTNDDVRQILQALHDQIHA